MTRQLRLKRKHFTATRIHEDLHPLHVVIAIRGVVSECFNAREVLDAPTTGVQERLVNAKVVRVAMHVGNRLAEGNHLAA
jgi:hypothetical protein